MILVILTGMFKESLIIFSIIIIHELGHMLAAKMFAWQIDSIVIYPFGGCVKFSEVLNKPLYQELIIMITGPLFQILYFLFIFILYRSGIININNYLVFKNYHFSILLFNLLPAIPLDGGRLSNIIFCYFKPYKKGLKLTVLLSYIVFIIVMLFILSSYRNYSLLLLVIFLITKVIIEEQNINYLYNKFILERYLNKYSFKRIKVINNKYDLYKDKKHIIKGKNRYVTEKEFLKDRYK